MSGAVQLPQPSLLLPWGLLQAPDRPHLFLEFVHLAEFGVWLQEKMLLKTKV